jgi:hypothetical protein
MIVLFAWDAGGTIWLRLVASVPAGIVPAEQAFKSFGDAGSDRTCIPLAARK